MPFTLTIAGGKGRGQSFQFDAESVSIGRGAENDVVLNDAGVSRLHARIERHGSGWMLLDNGSANGTELNGTALEKPSGLRAGDKIGVGAVTFEFGLPGDASGTRITAPPEHEQETRLSLSPLEPRSVTPRAGTAPVVWARISRRSRLVGLAVAAALVAGLAWKMVKSKPARGEACPETVAVDDETAGFSFGRGEVDVDCGNTVVFGFNAPQDTRVLFHYQATRIAAPGELELRLNGKHVGWAPVAGARGEPQAVTLPQEALGADGRNFVSFTQSQEKEWSVARVRVEMLAITPGDLAGARAAYDRGRRKLEERRIAPRNLYDAWKAFVEARRYLEGLSPRPPLYAEVAQLIKDCERDLDRECARLLFTAQRFERYGQDEKAQQTWREVLLYFPGDDPGSCRKKAQGNIVSVSQAPQ